MSTITFTATTTDLHTLHTQAAMYRGQLKQLERLLNAESNRLKDNNISSDDMTDDIFLWAVESTESLIDDKNLNSDERFVPFIQERIRLLGKEILIDPLIRQPLQSPVYDNEWVLNQDMMPTWRRLFPEKSPLSEKPWETNPQRYPYPLPEQVFSWIKEFCTSESSEPSTTLVPRQQISQGALCLSGHSEMDGIRRFTYSLVASSARSIRQERRNRRNMKNELILLREHTKKTKEQTELVVKAAEEESKAQTAFIEGRIDSIQETHRTTVDALKDQMKAQDEQNCIQIHMLQANLFTAQTLVSRSEESLTLAQRENVANRAELASQKALRIQLEEKIAQLTDQVNDQDDRFCSIM